MIQQAIVKIVNKEDLTYDEAYADALARAVELAKTRASVLAEASGQELGYVINIEEYGDRQEGRYVTSNMSMKSAPGAGAAEEAVEEEAEEPPQPVSTAADRMAQTARDAIFVRFIINYSFFC